MIGLAALATLVLSATVAPISATVHCAMRREISPCTCRREEPSTGAILVLCQRLSGYEQVARALTGKFGSDTKISLEVSFSRLPELGAQSFFELGLSITKLKLNFNELSELNSTAFAKLDLIDFFSAADNLLTEVPRQALANLPHVKTLDLCRNKITKLTEDDFREIQEVEHFVIAANQISKIERHALPKGLRHVHLGLNKLNSLNGALRDLEDLEWIFINANNLKTIENELPMKAKRLTLIYAAHNQLQVLPKEMKLMPSLELLYFYENNIKSLDGVLQKAKKLFRLNVSFNKIESLAADEFTEAVGLQELDVAHNHLTELNGALTPLRNLRYLNLTHNHFTSFSFKEIKGLKRLSVIDLSHNRIEHLTGDLESAADSETRALELRLEHNELRSLGGALPALRGLLRLNVSHNRLKRLPPAELAALPDLRLLDVSHNHITTLEDAAKAPLPALEELLAHHNNISALRRDFHGLPALCLADLSANQIRTVDSDLVAKSRCTINGVPGVLKIYLQDNPVACDERLHELAAALEVEGARVTGASGCPATLNDVLPPAPVSPPTVRWPSRSRDPPRAAAHH